MADFVKIAPVIVFGFFMAFTIKDLFLSQINSDVSNKEIPNVNLGPSKFAGPTLTILYCHSCGYKSAFEQYADVISKKYPEIVVVGRVYPASGYNSLLAKMLFLFKFLILACIISGANLTPYIGRLSSAWSWCISNKFYSCAMIFLICNMIEGHLISTGAFEISFNDVPVWSKLETGRIPQPPELFQIIDNQLRFQGKTFETNPEMTL
ncbi:UNVERIFIED_CONTAM: hypothetical protein PYX00_006691 [Menopon gallinae]|uniref:SelT-like protein n=1 Tax=Menopon gallinae TaxID=328185 RepID=A0AAW2HWB2_9NEOP